MIKYIPLMVAMTVCFLPGCKSKNKETGKNFVSVTSLIKKQVEKVDTSLYQIVKVVYIDSMHSDTSFIPRENFADVARDFLETPDLSDKKIAAQYREEPAVHDQMLNRVILTYVPIDPEKQEFKKQELLATPIPGEDARVNNIILIREIHNRDSSIQKKMLWQIDKYFQIVTTSQKPGKPETTVTTKVSWNEDTNQ